MHFISADCVDETPVIRLLQDISAIDLRHLKSEKPSQGSVHATPYKKRFVFSIFIKAKHNDPLDIETIRLGPKNLKEKLSNQELTGFRIS